MLAHVDVADTSSKFCHKANILRPFFSFKGRGCVLIKSKTKLFPSLSDARNMAKDVQTAFYEIAEEHGAMTHTQAVDYVKKLMTKGRYSQDVWS